MATSRANILVVDDEQEICEILCSDLSEQGYLCSAVPRGQDALAKLKTENFNIVLLDIGLPDISGMEILRMINRVRHNVAIIMTTGVDSIDMAVEAMKSGAVDYIVKPFRLDKINNSVRNVLENEKQLPGTDEQKIINGLNTRLDGELPMALEGSYKKIEAIAIGVQTRHDLILRHSTIVTRETVDVARQLGLSEEIIQRWVQARLKQDSEKKRTIRSSLDKLERSLAAQELLGLMRPYPYLPKNDESEN